MGLRLPNTEARDASDIAVIPVVGPAAPTRYDLVDADSDRRHSSWAGTPPDLATPWASWRGAHPRFVRLPIGNRFDPVLQSDLWEWLLRLTLAAALGALVGMERESSGHPAGVRTQALVALASALLTGVGIFGFAGESTDISRVASQVVTGIGFIGAGVILKHRGSVRGLTTAATLFLSAGLGIAVGAGIVAPALFATAIALVVIYGLRMLKPLIRRRATRIVEVDYVKGYGTFGPLLRSIKEAGGSIEDLEVEDDPAGDDGLRHVSIRMVTRDSSQLRRVVESLLARPEVEDARLIES